MLSLISFTFIERVCFRRKYRLNVFLCASVTTSEMLRENRFPGLEVPIDRILHLSSLPLSLSPSPPISFLALLFPDKPVDLPLSLPPLRGLPRLSLGVAPLLRFTFAMSLPVRSGRGKSVTQERSEAIGCDRTRVKEKNRARAPSSLETSSERSALCGLSHRGPARPRYETPIIRIKRRIRG